MKLEEKSALAKQKQIKFQLSKGRNTRLHSRRQLQELVSCEQEWSRAEKREEQSGKLVLTVFVWILRHTLVNAESALLICRSWQRLRKRWRKLYKTLSALILRQIRIKTDKDRQGQTNMDKDTQRLKTKINILRLDMYLDPRKILKQDRLDFLQKFIQFGHSQRP